MTSTVQCTSASNCFILLKNVFGMNLRRALKPSSVLSMVYVRALRVLALPVYVTIIDPDAASGSVMPVSVSVSVSVSMAASMSMADILHGQSRAGQGREGRCEQAGRVRGAGGVDPPDAPRRRRGPLRHSRPPAATRDPPPPPAAARNPSPPPPPLTRRRRPRPAAARKKVLNRPPTPKISGFRV